MAISRVASGAITYVAGAPTATPLPAGIVAGDLLVFVVGMKPDVTGTPSMTPAGWTFRTIKFSNSGAVGVDTGTTQIAVFDKIAVGNESGNAALTGLAAPNVSWSQVHLFRSSVAGSQLNISNIVGQKGPAGTNPYNVNAGESQLGFTTSPVPQGHLRAGDFLFGALVTPTDVGAGAAFSAHNVQGAGFTTSASTEINEPITALGNDLGGVQWTQAVATGSSTDVTFAAMTVNIAVAGTLTNQYGVVHVLRIREELPPSPPITVAATTTEPDRVTVTYAAGSADTTKYRVFRDGTLIGNTTATSFQDTLALGLGAPYANHSYTVTGGNAQDVFSTPSAAATGRSVVGPPDGIVAGPKDTATLVRWTQQTYTADYRVYLNGVFHSQVTTAPVTITGLVNGTSYTVGVSSVYNDAGTMRESAAATVSVTPRLRPPWLLTAADLVVTDPNQTAGTSTTASPNVKVVVGASTAWEALNKDYDAPMDRTRYVEFFYDTTQNRAFHVRFDQLALALPPGEAIHTATLSIFAEKGSGGSDITGLFKARPRRGTNSMSSLQIPLTPTTTGWFDLDITENNLANMGLNNLPDLAVDFHTLGGSGTAFNNFSIRIYGAVLRYVTRPRVPAHTELASSENEERSILYSWKQVPIAGPSDQNILVVNAVESNVGQGTNGRVDGVLGTGPAGVRVYRRDSSGQDGLMSGVFPLGFAFPRTPFICSAQVTADRNVTVYGQVSRKAGYRLYQDGVLVAEKARLVAPDPLEDDQSTERKLRYGSFSFASAGRDVTFTHSRVEEGFESRQSAPARVKVTQAVELTPTADVGGSKIGAVQPAGATSAAANVNHPIWSDASVLLTTPVILTVGNAITTSQVSFVGPGVPAGSVIKYVALAARYGLAAQDPVFGGGEQNGKINLIYELVDQSLTLIARRMSRHFISTRSTDDTVNGLPESVFVPPYFLLSAAELALIVDPSTLRLRLRVDRDVSDDFVQPNRVISTSQTTGFGDIGTTDYLTKSGLVPVVSARATIVNNRLVLQNLGDTAAQGFEAHFTPRVSPDLVREVEVTFQACTGGNTRFAINIMHSVMSSAASGNGGTFGFRCAVIISMDGSAQFTHYNGTSGVSWNSSPGLAADAARVPVAGDIYKVTVDANQIVRLFRNGTLLLTSLGLLPFITDFVSISPEGVLGRLEVSSFAVRNVAVKEVKIYAIGAVVGYHDVDKPYGDDTGPTATSETATVVIAVNKASSDAATPVVTEDASSQLATSASLAPDVILASTNLTGTVDRIQDDPDTPDALFLDGVVGPADLRVSFPNPPQPLIGSQMFRIRLREG